MGDPAAARSAHAPLRQQEHARIELFPRVGPAAAVAAAV